MRRRPLGGARPPLDAPRRPRALTRDSPGTSSHGVGPGRLRQPEIPSLPPHSAFPTPPRVHTGSTWMRDSRGISRHALAPEYVKSMAMVGPQPVPPHSTTPYTAGIQCLGFCWLSCTGFNMQAAMLSDAAIEEDLLSRRAGTKYFFNLFTVEGLSKRPALPAPKTAANQEDQPRGPRRPTSPRTPSRCAGRHPPSSTRAGAKPPLDTGRGANFPGDWKEGSASKLYVCTVCLSYRLR